MESYCGIWSALLIYYPLGWVMTTQLSEFPLPGFLWSCFIQAPNYSYIWYLGVFSDHYFGNTGDESGRSFFFSFFFFPQFIITQVLRSPKRFWQWLPSALVVWFVWSWSESNQWSMINMENSHYNHSFLWETTVWLCTKPWVNKPQNRQLY